MEKFTVDLDKVLDDFEYNEEQAIRHLREDLPAKKYQRPPFQRINLADADFSPSRQTSSPVIPYLSTQATNGHFPQPNITSNGHSKVSHELAAISDEEKENVANEVEENNPIPDLLGLEILPDDSLGSSNLPDLTETRDNFNEPVTCDLVNDSDIKDVENEESQSPELHELCKKSDNTIISEDTISPENESDVDDFVTNVDNVEEISQEVPKKDEQHFQETEVISSTSKIPKMSEVEARISIIRENDYVEDNDDKNVVEIEQVCGDLELMKPIAYLDEEIPDEDFTKFMEELEEEERDLSNQKELKKDIVNEEVQQYTKEQTDIEEKVVVAATEAPQRPTSLDLHKCTSGQEAGPSISTVVDDAEPTEDTDPEVNERDEVAPLKPYHRTRVEAVNVPPGVAESPPPLTQEERRLGKVSPFWVPDADALNCMQCGLKFTVIKRRHHCRACGRVLCSRCCGMRASLEYLNNQEHRVCELCFRTLTRVMMYEETDSEAEVSPRRKPNPNNPMEYCSTVPPPLQASPSGSQPPPSVLVPVLKREGASKNKETPKKVMFSDGIRPGGELTALDEPPVSRVSRSSHGAKRVGTPPGSVVPSPVRLLPPIDPTSQSFILEKCLPPICEVVKGQRVYKEALPREMLLEKLKAAEEPPVLFAVNRHLIVSLKVVKLDCCMGQTCWVLSTKGMAAVGQDEILILLQVTGDENEPIPCEVFLQLHYIHQCADKGNAVGDMGYWMVKQSTFLDSRQHGGFLFVRPTFQCTLNLDKPAPPYLVGILIHRLELPWARQFPLRLMLRLGAEFRYYPCSLISVRHREPVYYEIGQTIMNLLADFRSYTFTLPSVRGLRVHMEAQQTSVLIPRNRYDQVVRALNNSNEPVLALAGTFSPEADAHLVCMQSKGDEVTYSTQAINIHDKPRRVTGASFVVFNASLKAAAGVQGKSNIVEDGLMVEISTDTMTLLRAKLRALEDWSIRCGVNQEEVIQVLWCEDEKDFNRGVRSVIDGTPLDGVPSIRVHSGTNYMCSTRFIRWTEVFVIKCEDGATSAKIGDPLEVNRLSENIARATCIALTKAKLLDLLAAAGNTTIALRTTVTQDSVCYEAGSNGEKLAPIYMNSLDNELIPVLHKATANNSDACAILELVFHILDQ